MTMPTPFFTMCSAVSASSSPSARKSGRSEDSASTTAASPRLRFRSEKVYSYLAPISHYLIQFGSYLVLMAGSYMIVRGELTLGELVQFSSYSMMVYGPLQWMMNMPRWIANALIAVDRVFSVIDEKPEVVDREHAVSHRDQGADPLRERHLRLSLL